MMMPLKETIPPSASLKKGLSNREALRLQPLCPSPIPMDMDSMHGLVSFCPTTVSMQRMMGECRQYSLSPIQSEMEHFFPLSPVSVTFMPCVCVPNYPIEEGAPRKVCRRCSITSSELNSGSSTVAIDNKIEQAMDLVKSHLMFAVREEVEVLKEQIAELIERNNQLEYENGILRAAATPETLAKLALPRQQPQSSSSS